MTHPHDVALLYDLLDGRLGASAADELRRRLEEEPTLRATWDELRRMRAAFAALPQPSAPADFLVRVRQRAGLPPAQAPSAPPPAAAAAPPAAEADAPTGPQTPGSAPPDATSSAEPPAGRLLRMPRWALAAAAVALVALGIGLWASSGLRGERTALGPSAEVAKGPAPAPARALEGAEHLAQGNGVGERPEGGSSRRAPSAAPAAADGLAAGEGAPEAAPSGGRRVGGPVPAGPRAPSDEGALPPSGDAKRARGDAVKPATGDLAWARAGVDEVLVLRAATLDEARAQVSLWLAGLSEEGGAVPSGARLGATAHGREAGRSGLAVEDQGDGAEKDAAAAKRAAAEPRAGRVLGTFVVDLAGGGSLAKPKGSALADAEPLDRWLGGPSPAGSGEGGPGAPPPRGGPAPAPEPTALPPSAPPAVVAEPPAPPSAPRAPSEAEAPRRRTVRIVVVAR